MAPAGFEMTVENNGKKGGRRQRFQRAEKKNLIKPEWNMVGSIHKEDAIEVKFDIDTLSPEDQQEYLWKQTQRGLDESIKMVGFYKITRHHHHSKKLETPKMAPKVVPFSTEDPCPLFTEEPIPDTGMRGGMELECLYDKYFQKAFKHDLNRKLQKMDKRKNAEEKEGRFLTFEQPGKNYTITLSDGLQPYLFHSNKYMCNRTLCVTRMSLKEVQHELKQWYKSIKKVQVADKKVAKPFMEKEKSPKPNAFEVIFADEEEGRKFIDHFGNCHEDFAVVVRYPDVFEADEVKEETFYSIKAHWYPIPSTHQAAIWVKHEEDVGKAKKVLYFHGMNAEIVDQYSPEGSKMLMADWSWCKTEEFANDPVELETLVRAAFEGNGIELDTVHLERVNAKSANDEEIRQEIEKRLFQCLNQVEGEGMYIKQDKKWKLDVFPAVELQEKFLEQKARIHLKDQRTDMVILNGMMEMDTLFLCEKDRKGIEFSPVFTVKIQVATAIRTACHAALEELDTETRNDPKHRSHGAGSWARIRDNGSDGLFVEGWPKARVERLVMEVKELLKPRVIGCEYSNDNNRFQLLHGCGLALLNKLQIRNCDGVVISLDRLSEKMYLWADKVRCEAILDELDRFIQNPEKHHVASVIAIRQPRFLPVFKEVLAFNGEKAVSDAVGGAIISFTKDSVVFEGSVEQYEDLQDALDVLHTNMVESFFRSNVDYSMLVRKCPACNLPPSGGVKLSNCGHTYCLDCLTHKIRNAIRTMNLPIRCCSKGCEKLVPIKDIMDLLLDETAKRHQNQFTERFAPFSNVSVLKGSEGFIFCPNEGCQSVIVKPKNPCNKTAICSTCLYSVCTKCYLGHPYLSCEQVQEYLKNRTVPKGMYVESIDDNPDQGEVTVISISDIY